MMNIEQVVKSPQSGNEWNSRDAEAPVAFGEDAVLQRVFEATQNGISAWQAKELYRRHESLARVLIKRIDSRPKEYEYLRQFIVPELASYLEDTKPRLDFRLSSEHVSGHSGSGVGKQIFAIKDRLRQLERRSREDGEDVVLDQDSANHVKNLVRCLRPETLCRLSLVDGGLVRASWVKSRKHRIALTASSDGVFDFYFSFVGNDGRQYAQAGSLPFGEFIAQFGEKIKKLSKRDDDS